MDIVAWYIEIMEQGMDTRTIMKDYLKTKKELDQLRDHMRTYDAKMQDKINKYKNKYKEPLKMLKKQQQEVVKPLLSELKLKDLVYDRMKAKQEGYEKNFKVLTSILRLPLMCD